MKAADIMTTSVVTIDSLATIDRAAKVMKQHKIRALIVDRTSEADAYGIITATNISQAIADAQNPVTTYVYQVMTKPCIVVNPDLAVEHIANLFMRAKIRIAPVIKDKLLGIVSLTDILTKTDCLTHNKAKSTLPKTEKSDSFPLESSVAREWQIESEQDFEEQDFDNWCSG